MTTPRQKAYINVDLGEGYGNYVCGPDEELLPHIDFANVACGFHAGDPLILSKTVELCNKANVKVGAHPGLPDIQGFGRREITMTPEEHTANIIYQVGALQGFLNLHGMKLNHVKPHGILYGMMIRNMDVARAVWAGVPAGVAVFGLAGTNMETAAREAGLEFWAEYFADVKYTKEGMLFIDRKKTPWDPQVVRERVRSQFFESKVVAETGELIDLPIKGNPTTICCHSDSPGCVEIVKITREVADEYNSKYGFA
ncbi:uncharacterized protein FIESC28_00469 [Fusarium coffeatum]|uniref:Lactam utilization protein lamB n=1 Tax=Fusarium coffeatum TaxID=231269 RepID=A0A366SDE0_9HYPO|nr:uncharacterized protein FIESC28_00469 [Fusarium coffeatum]RBR26686.1 hypothetical protein FIESC28_00469 [Fusarium coffeatum]